MHLIIHANNYVGISKFAIFHSVLKSSSSERHLSHRVTGPCSTMDHLTSLFITILYTIYT